MYGLIPVSVANVLPKGFTIIDRHDFTDMDGNLIKGALIVIWTESGQCGHGPRKAAFDPDTGMYVGEYQNSF